MNLSKNKKGLYYKDLYINGKRVSLYSKDKKELESKIIETKHLQNKGISINNNQVTIEEWSNYWLATYKNNLSKSTINMYKSVIRLYIIPSIGTIKLNNIKQANIVDMLSTMDSKGITRRKDVALLTIKQILDKAVDNDYIYKNVATSIKIEKHKSAEKKPLEEDYIYIIKKLSESNPNAFMVYFLIYTGLRREELVPLKYSDLDFNNKIIHINKAVYFEKNQPILKTTKNKEFRDVPILNNIYEKLYKMSLLNSKDTYIFPNTLNKAMSETTFKRRIALVEKSINEQSDQKIHFTAHQLRHTYACILHKANVQLKEAQYFMGHKDIRVLLDIYTHLDDKDKNKAVKNLNKLIIK